MDRGERAEELVALAEGLREAIARATTSKEEPCIAMSSGTVQSVADRAQSGQNGPPWANHHSSGVRRWSRPICYPGQSRMDWCRSGRETSTSFEAAITLACDLRRALLSGLKR